MTKIEAEQNRYHGDRGWESDGQLFAKVAVTWKQWLGHAGEHLHVAGLLLPYVQERHAVVHELMTTRKSATLAPSADDIYFFHCALAVENSMKAVICRKFRLSIEQAVGATQRIPKVLLGHNLVALARRADFRIGIDEEFVLEFLTRYGTWSGKYPLPTSNECNALTARLSDGHHYLMAGYRPEMLPSFLSFAGSVYRWAREMAPQAAPGDRSPSEAPA